MRHCLTYQKNASCSCSKVRLTGCLLSVAARMCLGWFADRRHPRPVSARPACAGRHHTGDHASPWSAVGPGCHRPGHRADRRRDAPLPGDHRFQLQTRPAKRFHRPLRHRHFVVLCCQRRDRRPLAVRPRVWSGPGMASQARRHLHVARAARRNAGGHAGAPDGQARAHQTVRPGARARVGPALRGDYCRSRSG
jgi:hypothetical protein